SSRRRHTRSKRDWSSDVCSSDLGLLQLELGLIQTSVDSALRQEVLVQTLLHNLTLIHDHNAVHMVQSGETVRDDEGRAAPGQTRSEERRVGKEWRQRRWRGW